jgi:SAM-dependent methyltransferase
VMQFIPLLAAVEQEVVECFRHGGGVPYSSYERFLTLMAEDSATVHDASLIDDILPVVPGALDRLAAGIDVADIGCGQGHAVNLMAQAFPASRFSGFDFSAAAIAAGWGEAESLELDNARFEGCDVATLDAPGRFDLVTAFDAIHDHANPGRVLANIASSLRPGGTFLMGDIKASSHVEDNIEVPWAAFLYTASTLHCMTVSLALDGDGLGTVWGPRRRCGCSVRPGSDASTSRRSRPTRSTATTSPAASHWDPFAASSGSSQEVLHDERRGRGGCVPLTNAKKGRSLEWQRSRGGTGPTGSSRRPRRAQGSRRSSESGSCVRPGCGRLGGKLVPPVEGLAVRRPRRSELTRVQVRVRGRRRPPPGIRCGHRSSRCPGPS